MAAQAWKIYASAKEDIGDATIDLDAGIFMMSLHRSSGSGTITSLSTMSTWASVSATEITVAGGYAAGGRTMAGVTWGVGSSVLQTKWTYQTAGLVFTASGASLNTIRYAVIHYSVGAITSGPLLCYASLSRAAFTIARPITLTILPASTGVFTLA